MQLRVITSGIAPEGELYLFRSEKMSQIPETNRTAAEVSVATTVAERGFMARIVSHFGVQIDMGRGLPRILLQQRMDIRILCTSSIQKLYGPGGWSYLIWGLGNKPIQKAGTSEGVTTPLIQLHACIEALLELPDGNATRRPGETVKIFTDSDYVVKGVHNKEARQWKDSHTFPEWLDSAWQVLEFYAARHKVEWFYFDQWLLKEYESLHRAARCQVPNPKDR